MINVEMLLQQWPNLGELVLHLVRRVEDLEATVAYKDRRMEVLAKKIQLLEKGRTESEPYLLADRNGIYKPTEMLEGNKTEPQKELEKSDKKDQDLIGDPVILHRRWSTRPKKGGKAINSHEKKGESSGCVWSKNGNKWTKQSKKREQVDQAVKKREQMAQECDNQQLGEEESSQISGEQRQEQQVEGEQHRREQKYRGEQYEEAQYTERGRQMEQRKTGQTPRDYYKPREGYRSEGHCSPAEPNSVSHQGGGGEGGGGGGKGTGGVRRGGGGRGLGE